MQKAFELNDKVSVFDQLGVITDVVDTTKEPHLYGVTFDETGKTYVIEAEHIEKQRDTRPAIERIKTFDDAVKALGEDNVLVQHYRSYQANMHGCHELMNDIEAYLKLRIITLALNDGWQPTFTEDETRFYPWFWLVTEDEYNKYDAEDKARCCRVVGRSGSYASAYGGLVCASAYYASSYSVASNGSRLAFSSRELALYAGKQFIEEYANFYF